MNSSEKKPMSKKSKLILLALSIVILLVAAAILIPKYNNYLRNKRAAEIRTALEAVIQSVDNQWKQQSSISGITIEQAVAEAKLSKKITQNWEFVIAWKLTDIYTAEMMEKIKDVSTNETVFVAPYRMIMAYAKSGNPLGEGTKVWFLGDTNSYHGFGIDEKIEPDWKAILPNP